MSDISKLIEALRAGEAGATRAEDTPILPLGQPVVWQDGKLVKAPDVPKIVEGSPAGGPAATPPRTEAKPQPAAPERSAHESARTPAEGASPGPRQAEGGRDKK